MLGIVTGSFITLRIILGVIGRRVKELEKRVENGEGKEEFDPADWWKR